MSRVKEVHSKRGFMSLSTYYLEDDCHLARLHRRRCRHAYAPTIPLAMITMRKSIHGFPLVFYMGMGLCLAALWASWSSAIILEIASTLYY